MIEQFQQALESISINDVGLVTAALLSWVAIVYFVMAFGVRSGDLVWTGYWPGRLPANLRWRSFLYGLGLVIAGYVLMVLTDVFESSIIPDRWMTSAGFVVTAFLGIAGLSSLAKGSRWERMFFMPITMLGAGLAAWATFF